MPFSYLLTLSRSPAVRNSGHQALLPQPGNLPAPSHIFTYFSLSGRFSYELLLSCLLCTSCLLRELTHQLFTLSSEFSTIPLVPSLSFSLCPSALYYFPSKSTFQNQFFIFLMSTQQGPVPKSASPSWYRSSCTQWPEPETINPSLFNRLPHPTCYLLTLVPLYCQCLFNLELYQIWFENSYSLIQRFKTLAVQWNYLGSNKKCQCLGLTPRASDIIELQSTWASDC